MDGDARGRVCCVRVRRHLGERQRVRLLAGLLAERMTAADVNRHAALQVWQREIGLAVAAIGGAEQRNSAWFWLIGRNWPLQNAQPFGGKSNEKILISERKGSLIRPSAMAHEFEPAFRRLLSVPVNLLP